MKPIQQRRPTFVRSTIGPVLGLIILATCLPSATASVRERGGPRMGLIVASNVYLFATPFDSAAKMAAAMNRLQQPQPIGAYCGGAWRVHFAALLESPLSDESLNLEFYDLSSADRPPQRSRLFSSAVPVRPGDTTVFMNDFVISTDMGFVAAHTYEVSLWRPTGSGRTEVARGSFTLK